MLYFLAVLGGVLTTLSMVVNSTLGKRIGVIQSTLVNYIVGLLVSLGVIVTLGDLSGASALEISKTPFYIFLGGAIGVGVVYSSNIIIPKIPVVYSALLLFIGQIVCGIILDYFILGSFSPNKVIGAVIIIVGIIYNIRIDKQLGEK